ncbi:MAG TPA: hypothetical protein VGO07_03965 [Candidatus Saccharimonadales bacterium]|jgi:hypothetical protein|nr:hypothetical protein [Candidatus Saccharimonadales bacterium]
MMLYIIIAIVVAALGGAGFLIIKRFRPRALKIEHFQEQWQILQKLLSDKTRWSDAIVEADKLLDEALKKKRFHGGSMGERLVKAQRLFTDNDNLWFGHKLRNKIDADPTVKLKETEVKQALMGIRQGLKDIGALPNGQSGNKK